MGERIPFHRGEAVVFLSRSPGGSVTEHECRVKEMAGARAIAINLDGRDRIVPIKDVRKVNHTDNGHVKPPAAPAAKVQPPQHFAHKPEDDQREISVMVRGARQSRNLTIELMAQILRVSQDEIKAYEAGEVPPCDEALLRLSEAFNVPLQPLSAAQQRAQKRADEARAAREAAEQKKADEAREAAERAMDRAVQRPTVPRNAVTWSLTRALTLEDFCEQLMDLVALPIDKGQRKQWYTLARQLFELHD